MNDQQGVAAMQSELEVLRGLVNDKSVVWRQRDGGVEYMRPQDWIARASKEIARLRDVIDTYVRVAEASSREIAALRKRIPVTALVACKGGDEE